MTFFKMDATTRWQKYAFSKPADYGLLRNVRVVSRKRFLPASGAFTDIPV
jgi:hypothetical protein